MIGVRCRCFEVESFIECAGWVVFSMHGKSPDACDLGSLQSAEQAVFKQASSEPFALPGCVDRKAGKQHERYRVASQSLFESLGSVLVSDLANDQSVVSGDLPVDERNVCL